MCDMVATEDTEPRTEGIEHTTIRLPVSLKRLIARRALAQERTFSKQVIYLLKRGIEAEKIRGA